MANNAGELRVTFPASRIREWIMLLAGVEAGLKDLGHVYSAGQLHLVVGELASALGIEVSDVETGRSTTCETSR